MKSLLLGNGINIQFGGKAYTNRFIVQRIFFNVKAGKYTPLFGDSELGSDELFDIFRGLFTYANQVIEGKYDDNEFSDDMKAAMISKIDT
jgi:ABC-type taurine transport system ATPase subunit